MSYIRAKMSKYALIIVLIVFFAWTATAVAMDWRTYSVADGLTSDAVTAMLADAQGQVWIGTTEGLTLFDGQRWRTFSVAQGLPGNWVSALAQDRDGRIWCGSYGDGLAAWDGASWTIYDKANSGLPSDWIMALATDGQGRLWVGTLGKGVALFDGKAWTSYSAANSSLPSDWVSALAVDSADNVWVGTGGQGLCRVSGATKCYSTSNSALLSDDVTALVGDASGRLWVGTSDGLAQYDTVADVWWSWPDSANLPSPRVRALHLDSAGRLWVGTGDGLALYDHGGWTSYGLADGIAAHVVSGVATVGADEIWVGTLGGGVSVHSTRSPEPEPDYPVVLVHGWRGPVGDLIEDSEFVYLQHWLERDGRVVHFATGIDANLTLHENARALRDNIAQVKAETGAKMVDIIAFSMGGLDTRAYVESALYAQDVHQVFIMGTPHVGVTLWKTFLLHEIAHWTDQPSARELLPEQVLTMDRTHANNWGVPYNLYAGSVKSEYLPPLFGFLPPSDGLISAWSVHSLKGPAVHYITTDDLHAWSDETMLLGIPSYLWPDTTYMEYVRPALREGWTPPGSDQPPDWAPLPKEVHSPLLSGDVAPGQTITRSLEIDVTGTHRIYARWQTGSLDFSLVDPTGRVIDSTTNISDVSYFALDFANFASYVLTNTITGTWSCRLQAPDSLGETSGYAIYAVLDSSLHLEATLDQPWYKPGQPTLITAQLLDGEAPLAGAQVSADIYSPAHQGTTLPLFDDGAHQDGAAGDGRYANAWTAPTGGGYFPFFLSAQGERNGVAHARGTEGVILASRGTGSLTGSYTDQAVDADKDRRPEYLDISAAVDILRDGDYIISATLSDLRGSAIGTIASPLTLKAGQQTLVCEFPAAWIYAHAANGPYLVEGLTLLDENGAAIPLDEAGTYTTEPYDWRSFAP